jgi:outer membrane protein assembly factor BamB
LPLRAEDWPTLGRDRTHNAVSPEKNAPTDWQFEIKDDKGKVTKAEKNIKWSAKLGSRSLGGPIVANGLVWVGTNNDGLRDPALVNPKRLHPKTKEPLPLDMAVLMCFRESDGKFLWQYASPRLPSFVNDTPSGGLGSTPHVEGDRLWLITNRCETACFDIGPLQRGTGLPKLLWKVDMVKEFGIFPHGFSMSGGLISSIAADAERVYAVTNNGVDEGHINIPAPDAPSLVAFDKKTGRAVWRDNSPGKNILHEQISSPLVIEVKGKTQVLVGQGDGWLRAFEANTGRLVWKCDLNPKGAKYDIGGRGRKNHDQAAPVHYDGLIYTAPGQDVEHYRGENELLCIDPTGAGDVSGELEGENGKGKPNPNSRVVWQYGGLDKDPKAKRDLLFCRTLSRCTIHDGLVYANDVDGFAYCLDAKTGKLQWTDDLKAACWATPLWVDGKVYVVDENGTVTIYGHGREKKVLAKIESDDSIYASPVFANGTLYIMTRTKLYAIPVTK